MLSLPLWVEIPGAIAAVLVAFGTIYRYILPAIKGLWRIGQGTARLVDDFQVTGGFAGLAAQNAALAADMAAVKKELYPNGGTSMRDSLTRTEATTRALVDTTEELRGFAQQNREGIADLRDQVNDVSRRATDVAEVAQALGERQEVLRVADQQLARDLQHYVETEHRDLLLANEALRASLNEALGITEEES